MHGIEISLWGQPHVKLDGKAVSVPLLPSCWPLVALLALAEKPLAREWLASALWPDAADDDARSNLRRHAFRLQQALPKIDVPWILAKRKEVAWNPQAPVRVDALEFARAIAQERNADAVELYAGDLLPACYEEAIVELRERLRDSYLGALERLLAQARATRDLAGALRYAERLLETDEWREDAVRAAMAARYQSGDRSGALAAYERFAASLRDELRAAPMAETLALRDAILAGALLREDEVLLVAVDRETDVPLVGRGGELQAVRGAWLRAARGRGSALFIIGEAGIGKSRLTMELCATVEAQGGCALVGRTSSPEAGAYQAIAEALRDGLTMLSRGDLEDAWWATLAPLLPEIARLHPDLAELEELDETRSQTRLREGLLRLAAAMARRRPLAIVLEDLHWAQRETLEFVDALAQRTDGLPIVLALTHRSKEIGADHPLQATRRRLQHQRRGQTISLARLGESGVRALAAELLPEGRDADAAARHVYAISEGNPLFAVQLLRYYADTGEMPGEERTIRSVGDAVLSRINRLAPQTRAIAGTAALVSGTFTVEELASVGGWEESAVLAGLGTLLEAKIVCDRSGDRFTFGFTHALIESAIREAVPAEEAGLRRRRIAEVLEESRTHDGTAWELIASHWAAAGDATRAGTAYLKAARAALARYARGEGMRLAECALAYDLEPKERFEMLRIVVDESIAVNVAATDVPRIDELEALAARLGDDERFEALHRRAMLLYRRGDCEGEDRAIEEQMSLALASQRDDRLAKARLSRARSRLMKGEMALAEEDLRFALERARAAALPELAFRARDGLIQALMRQHKIAEVLAELDALRREVAETGSLRASELLAIAVVRVAAATERLDLTREGRELAAAVALQAGNDRPLLIARLELMYNYHVAWETATARAEFEWAAALCRDQGYRDGLLVVLLNHARAELEIGHFDRAGALLETMRECAAGLGARVAMAHQEMICAELALGRGNNAEALACAQRAYEEARTIGEQRFRADADGVLAHAEYANGQIDRAIERLNQNLDLRRSLDTRRRLAYELCLNVEMLLAAGRPGDARTVAAELRQLFEADPHHHVDPARIALALANEAQARGDAAGAEKTRKFGLRAIEYVLSKLEDAQDREAFSELKFNRALRG